MKAPLLSLALVASLACLASAQHYPVGDLNEDYKVNLADLQILADHWLDASCSAPDCPADLDGIPGVNESDFAILAQNWRANGKIPLVINEFMAKNNSDSGIHDEWGNYDDWIEIYNYGDEAIDIGGMWMTDNLDTGPAWQIPRTNPALTTIASHGYLLIWADSQTGQGVLHAPFALSGTGEDIGLYDADRNLIDSIQFGSQEQNKSYGQLPDANDNWQVFDYPTPEKSNQSTPVAVIINEIMYHPYHALNTPENMGLEYIELYNNGNAPVNLSGWRFTNGVAFVFPDVTLNNGNYLVVAADVNAFEAKYPSVTNVVGGWVGRLSNSGENIVLSDNLSMVIDRVHYADEGDWAVRELGPVDHSHRGWQWSDRTDGGGRSLELIDTALPNEYGQNWMASSVSDGTPGRINSAINNNIAPLILDVGHLPIIPGPNDQVTVTARVIDEQATGVSVTLHYRLDGEPNFTALPMLDDGAHGDGLAGNGVYGARIPAYPDKTVIEFFVEARDAASNTRAWPAPSMVDSVPQQVTNLLYQVDQTFDPNAPWAPDRQPIYYVIMTEEERAELALIGSRSNGEEDSDATMNCTFISVDGTGMEFCYNAGVRNRGHGTRTGPPNNYHVGFPNDRPWKDIGGISFNCRYTHSQIIGSAIFCMANIVAPDTTPAQLRINGADLAYQGSSMYGVYVRLEAFNDDFAKKHFQDDSNGNLYSCFRTGSNVQAELLYEGANPNTYRNRYFKENNVAEDDWSDLIHMLDVLNNAPDATYLQEVSKVINVQQWVHYIALNSLLLNWETGLDTGIGDDYFMYRGTADPRFVLIPHDLDTILDQGNMHGSINQSIFSVIAEPISVSDQGNGVDGLKRFFKHRDIVPLYYQAFLDHINGSFNPETLNPLFDQVLGGFAPQDRTNAMKQFVISRSAAVLAQIPQTITVTSAPTSQNGYPHTTSNLVSLGGWANAITTHRLTVNGLPATWTAWQATWSINNVSLLPGINRVVIQTFDAADKEVERSNIDIWYEDGNVSQISGTLATNTTLDAASGPWHVTDNITVLAGVTLTIQSGTTLFFEPGKGITINGRLLAEGTEYRRIRFTKTPGSGNWAGFQFLNTVQQSRIAYADMEYCDSGSCAIKADHAAVYMDHVIWGNHTKQYLTFDDSSIILKNSILPSLTGAELVHCWGFPADGYALIEGNWFGTTTGYNDIIDFTGGQRPGPIAQFLDNVFTGGSDDCIDMDAADAHVEGNVFMHVHMDSPRETLSHAVTTGTEYGQVSEVTAVRNLFYDVDHAFLSKDGGYITAVNNTIVGVTVAAVNMYEARSGQWQGLGFYGDGNIFYNAAHMFENPDWAGHPTSIIMNNSIFPIIPGDPVVWTGSGNLQEDPQLFKTTNVTNPQIDFMLRPTSPAIGTGPNGQDMGGLVPAGASISGEPAPRTRETNATLTVGGPDIYGYKYRVNNGPWSGEILRPDPILPGIPIQPLAPIEMPNLTDGTYTVYVIIKNSASVWQNESEAVASRTWIVDSSYWPSQLVINEVLAHTHGAEPDLIELYYDGPGLIDLTDMSLTDDPCVPRKFIFSSHTISPTTIMNPGDYLLLFGDLSTNHNHLGFALSADGEGFYLYDKPANGGGLIDSVVFGPQINNFSIGRVGYDRQWKLNKPTFGYANTQAPLGNPDTLKINEWLTNEEVLFEDDFIELHNPHANPVDLGGMYLTDNPATQPKKSRLGPLSFIAGKGFAVFTADDSNNPSHVNFRLSADQGMIGLFDAQLKEIDKVLYGPQTTDVSYGRSPDDSNNLIFFELPTPGVSNPGEITTTTTITLMAESATKRVRVPTGAISDNWKGGVAFDDSGWNDGTFVSGKTGGVGYENNPGDPTNYTAFISRNVESLMYNIRGTCYIRIPFTVDANVIDDITGLTLKMRYDDGFLAYINGTPLETATRNFTGTPAWTSLATSSHADGDAVNFEHIPISGYIGALRSGSNILAIHGLNGTTTTSTDFLISPELEATITEVNEAFPYPEALKLLDGLRITELMYHAPDGSEFDFLELYNISDTTLDLNGVQFIQGIDFTFPPMTLESGHYVVVVSNIALFQLRYGSSATIAGQYSGNLSNGGEDIVLKLPAPLEAAILRFRYGDAWYPTTDGLGASLTICDPLAHPATWNQPESWRAASPTPGGP
jgi:hypothetical protein